MESSERELQLLIQSLHEAAASSTGTTRRVHITPVLRQLHWLPVRQRVQFKLVILVHRSLSDSAPEYLADDQKQIVNSSPTSEHVNFALPTPEGVQFHELTVRRSSFFSCWSENLKQSVS